MDNGASNPLPAFGFLTVVEDDRHGFFGGYLVLSELGRPLEFHCSTPILPSPAQRILYGSTLRSYVLGELIGQTLVRKAQLPVLAVLTDLEEMLSLGLVWQGTLAWASSLQRAGAAQYPSAEHNPPAEHPSAENPPAENPPAEHPSAENPPAEASSPEVELGGYRLVGSSTCRWSPGELCGTLSPLVSYVDLAEPFERIREAIQEAQRVTEPSTGEADDHSTAA